jgi:hypothetical protein
LAFSIPKVAHEQQSKGQAANKLYSISFILFMTIIFLKKFFFPKNIITFASKYHTFLSMACASIIEDKRMARRKLLTGLNDWILIAI